VAEFIGAANIVEAKLDGGALVLPGGRLAVEGGAGAAQGSAGVAMIRPETIRIVEAAGASLTGTVDSVAFIGDRQRIVVSGASDRLLTIDAPNTIAAKAGDRIGLSIAPEAVRLLPREG
jgi:putative spermidine/putrescine transport system ATP-binding protein